MSMRIVPAIVFLLLFPSAALSEERGPAVGSFAPELVPCQWLQRDRNHPPELRRLAGKVVLIHTFAYLCDA